MKNKYLAIAAILIAATSPALAAKVYVMSSGDAATDSAVMANMQRFAHQATLGVPFNVFDGTIDLSSYDSVYMQSNYNWATGDMPQSGQAALAAYVNNGGGLVAAEWALWKVAAGSYQTLGTIYAAQATSSYNGNPEYDFSQATADPIINAGLPSSFVMPSDNYAGMETNVTAAQTGAIVFYNSTYLGNRFGLTGWDFGNGRVINFSTTNGPNMLNDPNGGRLISNAIEWVGNGAGGVAVFPTAKTVQFGKVDSGDTTQLYAIDGNVMRICKYVVPNLTVAPITVSLDGTTGITTPVEFGFRTFSRMNAAGSFSLTLDLYDWSIPGYSATATTTAPISSSYVSTIIKQTTGNLARFVGSAGTVRARYRVKTTGFVATAAWCHELDQAVWFIR